MNKYLIECDLELRSSHDISEIGFEAASTYNLDEGVLCNCPFGLPNTQIELSSSSTPIFKVKIVSFDLINKDLQVSYLTKLASYLSFIAAKDEHNGHNGTPYIKIIFNTFNEKIENVENDTFINNSVELNSILKITDSLSIKSINSIRFTESNVNKIHYNELLDYYYNGLRAESEKSKFFHWFLIIESLEGCDRYAQLFPNGTMFTAEENNAIKNLANKLSDEKKNALLSVLTRTSEFRNPKLFKFISTLGIYNLSSIKGTEVITLELVKSITSARNKLFHRGNEFPKNTLWLTLFPLVTSVIETIINNPSCLERS